MYSITLTTILITTSDHYQFIIFHQFLRINLYFIKFLHNMYNLCYKISFISLIYHFTGRKLYIVMQVLQSCRSCSLAGHLSRKYFYLLSFVFNTIMPLCLYAVTPLRRYAVICLFLKSHQHQHRIIRLLQTCCQFFKFFFLFRVFGYIVLKFIT